MSDSPSPYSGSAIKRSAGHFMVGKIASALLTFGVLLWLVRLLTLPEYSAYITFVASLEITMAIATVGLPWMEARYLPEFRLYAPKAQLIRFVIQLIQCQLVVLLLVAGVAWLYLDWLLLKMDIRDYRDAAELYLLMLIFEGGGRRIRDSILSVMLQQALAQASLVIRNLLFVIGLAIFVYQGNINLVNAVIAELLASVVGLILPLIGLWWYLKRVETEENQEWVKPAWSQMWAVAKNMYFSQMITQVYSSQVFTLIIRYSLGEEATAVFGFLRNLYSQVMNYLPASLLFGLIRPKLIASYLGDGGIAELTRNANMVGKVSLFVLMPLLVFSCLTGEELISTLSGGKFSHTGYYMAGLMLTLVPVSQRQILETVAVVTGNSHLCNYAAILGIITLPVTYGLIQIGFDLWAPIIAIMLGTVLFCSTILRGVMRKTAYHADFAGFCRMLSSASIACLGGYLVLLAGQGWIWIAIVATLSCLVFLIAGWIIKPFSNAERLRINQLIKRNLFVW